MKEKFQPTESELEILQVLWEHQPCTIRFIHEELSKKKQVGYTTILKQMQRMLLDDKKKMVERVKSGKTHLYTAVPKEVEIQQTLSEQLLKTAYKGSAMKLAMHALGQGDTSMEELEALQKWLSAQKKKSHD